MFQKLDARFTLFQFLMITYAYGMDRYLSNLREVNGRMTFVSRLFRVYKYVIPSVFIATLLTQDDNRILNYVKKNLFSDYLIIGSLESYPIYLNLFLCIPIIVWIVIEVIKNSIQGYYWKTVFRSLEFVGKRNYIFSKSSKEDRKMELLINQELL
uniref:Acyltransferase n=1 Tax=Parastrongyloides trichosuri TaxID=131310 RepID=A0A0N4ZU71_PARTI